MVWFVNIYYKIPMSLYMTYYEKAFLLFAIYYFYEIISFQLKQSLLCVKNNYIKIIRLPRVPNGFW